MSQLFSAFGIDWRLLVINIINFGLLLAALWYFLYGPLMRSIESRRRVVSQGVEDAKEAEARLREVESARGEILAAAGREADDLIAKAREAGAAKEREIVAAGEAAAARVLSEAHLQARDAKEQALEESRKEVAKLVVLGIEKAMAGKQQ